MATNPDPFTGGRIGESRRQRAEEAGKIMAEPPATAALKSAPGPQTVGPVTRWVGRAIGSLIGAGAVVVTGLLVIKAILWAWYL